VSRNPPAQVALALFAEAIADPVRRRGSAADPLDLMKSALASHGHDFDSLDGEVRAAFTELFGDLSYEELRLLGNLQAKLVALDPDQSLGLTEQVEVGSFATLAKL
jgi:hypothetical protein